MNHLLQTSLVRSRIIQIKRLLLSMVTLDQIRSQLVVLNKGTMEDNFNRMMTLMILLIKIQMYCSLSRTRTTSLFIITSSRSLNTMFGLEMHAKMLKMTMKTRTGKRINLKVIKITKSHFKIWARSNMTHQTNIKMMIVAIKSSPIKKVRFFILPILATILVLMSSWHSWKIKVTSLKEQSFSLMTLESLKVLVLFKWTLFRKLREQLNFSEMNFLQADRWL